MKLAILMYADDIVLLSDSEEKLQSMLDTLNNWCKRWRVIINTSKSKCMHFRKGRTQRTEFPFKIGGDTLELVDHYKYLGVIFQERSDYSINCEALSKGAGRALGSLINKIHHLKDFGFRAFEKLFNSCVVPILDYGASVWGTKQFQSIDNVQHRALRYFLGVHRFTPILALYGDSGWLPSLYRRWICVLRYWNRLLSMDNNRLTKRVFDDDYRQCRDNWSSEVRKIMGNLNLLDNFNARTTVPLSEAKALINDFYKNKWVHDVQSVAKLRTYRLFKTDFKCEEYLVLNLDKNERSSLCQLRFGILPLRIETGRYVGEPVNSRICRFCNNNSVEDERHFLLECPEYDSIRLNAFRDLPTNVINEPTESKFVTLLTKYPRKTAKYIASAYLRRRSIIYT